MAAIRNPAREKLENGELSLGCGVRLTRSVEIGIAMKSAGFDWLFIDCEHGTMSLDAAAQIAVAALDAGIAPIVRVPNGEYSMATRVLDNVRMPHIQNFNMAILKEFPLRERVKLAFRAEMYGVLNHPTFSTNQNDMTLYTGLSYVGTATPVATANNVVTSFSSVNLNMGGNRTIQLGLKLYF